MGQITLKELRQAADLVYQEMPPTPQYEWPLLSEIIGTKTWVKHENHTPTGAFKIRGGITFIHWLKRTHPDCKGIVTATRGNHGQSQARAAVAMGLTATIVVPKGNSVEKNNAMRAFGATLIEHGEDFDTAKFEAMRLSEDEGLFMVPPFHPQLILGVSSYALELFEAIKDLDVVYVPIGCGSGICGLITARDLLGIKTEIIGVVADEAQTAKLSFDNKQLTETPSANTFADGMAVRVPVKDAYDIYSKGAKKMVSVSEAEIAEAVRLYYSCTHNLAEGAGAAPLAAIIKDKDYVKGKKAAIILTGGNIDTGLFKQVLSGITPQIN